MSTEATLRILEVFILCLLTLVEARIFYLLKRNSQENQKMSTLKPILVTALIVLGTLAVLNRGKNLPGVKQINSLVNG